MATASRYAGVAAPAPAPSASGSNGSTTTSSGSTNSSGNTSTTGTSTTETTGSSTTNTSSRNMGAQALQQLYTLINQLMAGGTRQMLEDRARRQEVLNKTTQQQAAYSKEAAFGDAQGAMAQQSRRTMEALMPSITRAAEGAGTSANSMRALLVQDAANKAAESASALGLKAAVDYGNISTNYAQVLEALSRPDTTAINALLQAFNVAKGAETSSTSTTNSNQTSVTNSSQNTITNNQSNTNNTQTTTPNGSTSGGSTSGSGNLPTVNSGMSSFGDTSNMFAAPANQTNSFNSPSTGGSQGQYGQGAIYSSYDTANFLKELYGTNRWSNYSF